MSAPTCAICYGDGAAKLCDRCKGCAYCSKTCQQADWASHKLLCRPLADMAARPSPSHFRALFFPVNAARPRLVWLPCVRTSEEWRSPLDPELEPDQRLIERDFLGFTPSPTDRDLGMVWGNSGVEHVRFNPHRDNAPMPHVMRFYFRDNFYNDGSLPNRSLAASVKPHGPENRDWRGPLLVVAFVSQESDNPMAQLSNADFTLADFRSVIDYSLGYQRH